ncbi:F-box/kelch-repeat protein At3g23880-like [Solanum dulcamara]|uniref:F-box/kelch-repeat protein At3g23880-like n=1 Tax=Solanum dulcamara TaxID=45834 RepID=UPI002485DB19|nr:F-box/kelch-repeat protein At3g23880-like [Solanum dulcamara]
MTRLIVTGDKLFMQKWHKRKRSVHGNLAITKASKVEKKKSIVKKKEANLSNQIIISNTENVDQISNGEEEEATQKFNFSRCQHKKKKKSVLPYQICKGKSPSNYNTDQREIDQCDGLVLILVSSGRNYEEILLWNPSTRESILLPYPDFRVIHCVCGLGYDATSEDYKILAINLNAGSSFDDSIELLSLKSGSWRKIGYPTSIQRVRDFRDCGMYYLAFIHGAFHWLVMSVSGYYTTVSFNISNEEYGEVPLLEQMYDVFTLSVFIDHGVSVLRGMLCFYSTCNYGMEGTFKLLVMKDYGVRESWTKLIKLRDTDLFYSARPKYMFADCEVLLHCKRIGCVSSKFTTSRGPSVLCPQCDTMNVFIKAVSLFISCPTGAISLLTTD